MSQDPTNPDQTVRGRDPLSPDAGPPAASGEPGTGQPHDTGQPYGTTPGQGGLQPYGAIQPTSSGPRGPIAAIAGVLLGGLLFVTAALMVAASTRRLQYYDLSLAGALPMIGFALLSFAAVAGLAITARFSSVGLYLAGAMHLIVSMVYLFRPDSVYPLLSRFGEMARGTDFYLVSGGILVGATLIAFGAVAGQLRSKARAAGHTPLYR